MTGLGEAEKRDPSSAVERLEELASSKGELQGNLS